jgi:uncharacterized repeat protein (TIGR02543 family)
MNMKKKILSLALTLTLVLALVPVSVVAQAENTPMFITIEVPGIPGMTIEMEYFNYDYYFHRISDGAVMFAIPYGSGGDLTFNRDLTLHAYTYRLTEEYTFDDIIVKAGEPVSGSIPFNHTEYGAVAGSLSHYFTIDGITVYLLQSVGQMPFDLFLNGWEPMDWNGLISEWNSPSGKNFFMRPISSIANIYPVTVDGSIPSAASGAGSYTAGVTVTISAGSRIGFSFSGWTVNSGSITLADASNTTTTFTMPANNVVVTANWTPNENTVLPPVFSQNITIEVPGIPGMTIGMSNVFDHYFYRESDKSILFLFGYAYHVEEGEHYIVFDRDLTLKPIPEGWTMWAGGHGTDISIESGVVIDVIRQNGFTIDDVNVYFLSMDQLSPTWFIYGMYDFPGGGYVGLAKELEEHGFVMRPISDIAAGATQTDPLDSASTWAREGIASAIQKGFVPAEIQGSYTDVITRQEFCRMAVKWVEYATGKDIDTVLAEKGLSRNPGAFTDTNDPDILAAFALGITTGTGNNQFTPDGQFNREQAATMLMRTLRAAGLDETDAPAEAFADINTASNWAVEGINFVRANGIMDGTGDNNFSPQRTFTREQAIITFNRINGV